MILANHNEGRFRTRVAEETVLAGSSVQLKVEGITPLAPLAIRSGRLNGDPLDLSGKVIIRSGLLSSPGPKRISEEIRENIRRARKRL